MGLSSAVERLWQRHFAGDTLTPEQERQLRLSGPHPSPNRKGSWLMGPGCSMKLLASMPCYLCGSRVKKGVDLLRVRLAVYADHQVLPEGVYRLCRSCDALRLSFVLVHATHIQRHKARLVDDEYASLAYYHPPIPRERL